MAATSPTARQPGPPALAAEAGGSAASQHAGHAAMPPGHRPTAVAGGRLAHPWRGTARRVPAAGLPVRPGPYGWGRGCWYRRGRAARATGPCVPSQPYRLLARYVRPGTAGAAAGAGVRAEPVAPAAGAVLAARHGQQRCRSTAAGRLLLAAAATTWQATRTAPAVRVAGLVWLGRYPSLVCLLVAAAGGPPPAGTRLGLRPGWCHRPATRPGRPGWHPRPRRQAPTPVGPRPYRGEGPAGRAGVCRDLPRRVPCRVARR